MPINIPLALWIVYSAEGDDAAAIVGFTESLVVGTVGTGACALAMWLAARAELRLGSMILLGYLAWGAVWGALWWCACGPDPELPDGFLGLSTPA